MASTLYRDAWREIRPALCGVGEVPRRVSLEVSRGVGGASTSGESGWAGEGELDRAVPSGTAIVGRRRGRVKRLAVASFSCRAALLTSDSTNEALRDRIGRGSGLGGPLERRCSAAGVRLGGDTPPAPPMVTRRRELWQLPRVQPFGPLRISWASAPTGSSGSLYRRSVCAPAGATRGGSCRMSASLSMARGRSVASPKAVPNLADQPQDCTRSRSTPSR